MESPRTAPPCIRGDAPRELLAGAHVRAEVHIHRHATLALAFIRTLTIDTIDTIQRGLSSGFPSESLPTATYTFT